MFARTDARVLVLIMLMAVILAMGASLGTQWLVTRYDDALEADPTAIALRTEIASEQIRVTRAMQTRMAQVEQLTRTPLPRSPTIDEALNIGEKPLDFLKSRTPTPTSLPIVTPGHAPDLYGTPEIQKLATQISIQIMALQDEVATVEKDVEALATPEAVALDTTELDSKIDGVDNRLEDIELAIMENPAKALQVSLLRKELELAKNQMQFTTWIMTFIVGAVLLSSIVIIIRLLPLIRGQDTSKPENSDKN